MNCDKNMHIRWPALLIQKDQAELVYLASEHDWLLERLTHIEQTDRLLDASGVTYELALAPHSQFQPDKQLSWQLSDEPLRLPQILDLVRQHASLSGHCCTAKLRAESMEQVFEIMKFLEEN
ncbi:hypothetical protein EKG39_12650 [Shewanella atlantica]|uniref:Uncharacterized protein n=2 Tax=Shewanella atlantica TaxID=271099 RepID=A0A431W809_9GAMM|nr:hypothetical protein EKG39_12650 [Shewanella atlantica]